VVTAIRQQVTVQPGGVIELRSPELMAGARAEVIILLGSESPTTGILPAGPAGSQVQPLPDWRRYAGTCKGGVQGSPDNDRIDGVAFDRGTDPILRLLTAEQARALVAYRGDDALRQRIEELAARNTEGALSEPEHSEYEGYVRANHFIAVLQAKARRILAGESRR